MIEFLLSLFYLALLAFFGAEPSKIPQEAAQSEAAFSVATSSARFLEVVDGDTIKFEQDGKRKTVRVIGINTPETVDPRKEVECFGKEASAFAKDFFASASATFVLGEDSSQGNVDKYGRLLRYVSRDGVDYGEQAVRQGFAHEYTYDVPYKHQELYKAAEQDARSAGRGLWKPGVCE